MGSNYDMGVILRKILRLLTLVSSWSHDRKWSRSGPKVVKSVLSRPCHAHIVGDGETNRVSKVLEFCLLSNDTLHVLPSCREVPTSGLLKCHFRYGRSQPPVGMGERIWCQNDPLNETKSDLESYAPISPPRLTSWGQMGVANVFPIGNF